MPMKNNARHPQTGTNTLYTCAAITATTENPDIRNPLALLRKCLGQLSMTYVALEPYSPAMPIPIIRREKNITEKQGAKPQATVPIDNSTILVIIASFLP